MFREQIPQKDKIKSNKFLRKSIKMSNLQKTEEGGGLISEIQHIANKNSKNRTKKMEEMSL